MSSSEFAFVLGPPKAATSSLVGMLNQHPEVFLLYEVRPYESLPDVYAQQLIRAFPESRRYFHDDPGLEPYRGLRSWLEARGHRYRVFGDKIPTLDQHIFDRVQGCRVLYAFRDLESWLAKPYIRKHYLTEENVVPAATDYLRHMVASFRLPDVLYLPMQDFITDNERVRQQVFGHLGLEPPPPSPPWWESVGGYAPEDPKAVITWWEWHRSSQVEPRQVDTRPRRREHPFWDVALPLFERLRDRALSGDHEVPEDELQADLAALEALRTSTVASLDDCFESIESRPLVPARG